MRIGVIGAAGKIGQMRVRSILENPATSLAAVMDLNIEAAKAIAPAPFGPSSAENRPGANAKLTSSSARRSP